MQVVTLVILSVPQKIDSLFHLLFVIRQRCSLFCLFHFLKAAAIKELLHSDYYVLSREYIE